MGITWVYPLCAVTSTCSLPREDFTGKRPVRSANSQSERGRVRAWAVLGVVSRPPAVSEAGGESVAQGGAAAGVSRPPAVPSAGAEGETGPRMVAGGSGLRVERRFERTRSR